MLVIGPQCRAAPGISHHSPDQSCCTRHCFQWRCCTCSTLRAGLVSEGRTPDHEFIRAGKPCVVRTLPIDASALLVQQRRNPHAGRPLLQHSCFQRSQCASSVHNVLHQQHVPPFAAAHQPGELHPAAGGGAAAVAARAHAVDGGALCAARAQKGWLVGGHWQGWRVASAPGAGAIARTRSLAKTNAPHITYDVLERRLNIFISLYVHIQKKYSVGLQASTITISGDLSL